MGLNPSAGKVFSPTKSPSSLHNKKLMPVNANVHSEHNQDCAIGKKQLLSGFESKCCQETSRQSCIDFVEV